MAISNNKTKKKAIAKKKKEDNLYRRKKKIKKRWDFKKIKNHKKSRFKKKKNIYIYIYIWEELESFKIEILQKKSSYLKKKARFKIYIYIYMRRTQDPQEKRWYLETKKKKERDFKNKYMRRTRVFETRETQVWGLIILSGNFVDCVQVYKFFPRETRVFNTQVLCKFYLNIK